jgi:hypothetical protein
MNKKQLSERDICTKFITPALRRAGWDEITQLREEVSFTKGRIIVRGKLVTRGKRRIARGDLAARARDGVTSARRVLDTFVPTAQLGPERADVIHDSLPRNQRTEEPFRLIRVVRAAAEFDIVHRRGAPGGERDDVVELQEAAFRAAACLS